MNITMNKHDKKRIEGLVKTLAKAKDQAGTAHMYLIANHRDPEDIATVSLVLEHIEITLEHLGAARACRVCGCTEHHACLGGCYWVEEDLCSSCVGVEMATEAGGVE